MSRFSANKIRYNNSVSSSLNSSNIQDAIDEQQLRIVSLEEKLIGIESKEQSGSYTCPSLGVGNRYQKLILFDPPFKNIPNVKATHNIASYLIRSFSVSDIGRGFCIISITSGYNSVTPTITWTVTEGTDATS